MPLRKLIVLVAAAATLAACSTGSPTEPESAKGGTRQAPRYEDGGTGMLGGGGRA